VVGEKNTSGKFLIFLEDSAPLDITEHLFLPPSDDVATIPQVYSNRTAGCLEREEENTSTE